MAYIILPHRWTRQPPGPVGLSSHAAQGVEFVVDGRLAPREITRGAAVTVGTSVSNTVAAPGRLLNFAGGNVQSYFSLPITALGTGDWTFLLLAPSFETFAGSSSARYPYVMDLGSSFALLVDHPDNSFKMGLYDGAARACGPSINSRQQYRSMAWRRSGNTMTAWLDGATSGTTYTYSGNLTATTMNIGAFKALGNAVLHPVGWFDFAILYRSALSDARLKEIGINPYGDIFSPIQRRIYVPSAAVGGDVTQALTGSAVTASAGTLAPSHSQDLSGTAATASAGTLAPSHSQSLSGQAVTASAGALVPSHSQALSGQAVTASAGTITYTTAGAVNVTLSGQAVVVHAQTIEPSHSQALAGQAVTASAGTIAYTGGTVLTLALSGQAVTVTAGSVSPAVALLLAGSSIVVSGGTITIPGGGVSEALTGEAVSAHAGTLTAVLTTLGAATAASPGRVDVSTRRSANRETMRRPWH